MSQQDERAKLTDAVRKTSQYYLIERDDESGFRVVENNIIGVDAAHKKLNETKKKSKNPEAFQVLTKIEAEALFKGIRIGKRLGKRKKRLPSIYQGLE